jgi:hypothetical protein
VGPRRRGQCASEQGDEHGERDAAGERVMRGLAPEMVGQVGAA